MERPNLTVFTNSENETETFYLNENRWKKAVDSPQKIYLYCISCGKQRFCLGDGKLKDFKLWKDIGTNNEPPLVCNSKCCREKLLYVDDFLLQYYFTCSPYDLTEGVVKLNGPQKSNKPLYRPILPEQFNEFKKFISHIEKVSVGMRSMIIDSISVPLEMGYIDNIPEKYLDMIRDYNLPKFLRFLKIYRLISSNYYILHRDEF